MNEIYRKQVSLLIRIMPLVHKINDFAVHGGTAINLNVNQNLTVTDREFLISFESGNPDWDKCCAGDLSSYPAIQWKLKNILKLKETNPSKFSAGIKKLYQFIFPLA